MHLGTNNMLDVTKNACENKNGYETEIILRYSLASYCILPISKIRMD